MRGLGDADARGEARQQSASLWILPDRDDIRDIKTELLDVYQAESRMSLGSVGNMSTTEKILLGAHSGVQAQSQHILTEAEENSLLSSFTESCTVCAKLNTYDTKQARRHCAVGLVRKPQTHGAICSCITPSSCFWQPCFCLGAC